MKKNKPFGELFYRSLKKTLLTMRIAVIFMILGILQANAKNVYSQNTKLSLNFSETELVKVLDKIEAESEFFFLYNEKLLDTYRKVSITANDQLINVILDNLFAGTDVKYTIIDRKIILAPDYLTEVPQTQQVKISGTITDENGRPMPGINIMVEGTTIGVISDANGKYSINLPNENAVLIFSFVGYSAQKVTTIGKMTIDVKMVPDIKGLEEVVVVGYGTQKKLNLTAAVDQVTNSSLENRSIPNLTQGLEGVMPNLNIKLLDGKPTQAPSYNIRGTTSIGQGGSALILIDGVEGDPSMLNPNDVASVTMLKDAASASIYGARGAFGVVLITTKSPEKGKTSVTYSTTYSIKSPVAVPKVVTDGFTYCQNFVNAFVNYGGTFPQNINLAPKFSQAYYDAFKAKVESGQPYSTVDIDPTTGEYVYYESTDWFKLLYKPTTGSFDNNISISGSGPKVAYIISGRFLNQDGLYRYNTDDYSMKNFRAKGSIQIFPWLQVENNTSFNQTKYHNPMNSGSANSVWALIGVEGPSNTPLLNPDGTLTMTAAYQVGDFYYGKNAIDLNKAMFSSTSGFNTQFFDNKFRIKGAFTFSNTDNNTNQRRVPVPYSIKPGTIAYVGTTFNDLTFDQKQTKYLSANVYGEYENTFLDSHYLKVMAGYNYEQSTYNRLDVTRNGLIIPDASDISLALGTSITTIGGYEQWAILGGFSRVNYSFKDRYLLELNARYDGSSKFPSNQRYAFFPSISGGWRISKESFWNLSPKIISNLKVRASYGSLGNGNIASYAYQDQFTLTKATYILNGVLPQYTTNPSVLPNGLTWETATTTNFGLDIATLSDRLTFVGDVYVRNTTDMYTIGLTLPATFGATAPKGNNADLQTKGWELSLTWRDKFNIASKPLNYNFRFTLADNRSVITKYNNPDKLLSDYYEGMVIGEIWGYTTEGFFIDQADIDSHAKQSPQMKAATTSIWYPGDIKLKDMNDDGFINIGNNRVSDPGDRKIIGNNSPRYLFGINLGADWNNFFFSTFFQGVGKQDWYPSSEAALFWGPYNRPYNIQPVFQVGNMWTTDNTNAYFPRLVGNVSTSATAQELGVQQTKYLQNIAYIRLKNIQIGYNLPKKLISKIGASDLKIYFSGENLWCYSPLYKVIGVGHLDVENTGPRDQLINPITPPTGTNYAVTSPSDGYNYPMMKSFSFGLSITF